MSNTASRAVTSAGDESSMAEREPNLPSAQSPVLERGAVLTVHVKVLRVDGPWVNLSVAGNLLRVLRSALEKELA